MVDVTFNKSGAIAFRLTHVAHGVTAAQLEAGANLGFARAGLLDELHTGATLLLICFCCMCKFLHQRLHFKHTLPFTSFFTG